MFVISPTNNPIEEIIPSSDNPIYSVGIKDKNPIIDVEVTINKELEIDLVVCEILLNEGVKDDSKLLKQSWIPKSTEIPIKSTAKATDIIFKFPIKKVVSPNVRQRPKIIDNNKIKIT